MNYLKQKATPWVSFSALAGGMVAAVMLFFLARVENDVQSFQYYGVEEELYSEL